MAASDTNSVPLIGRRFGRLVVLKIDAPHHCLCRCDCGKETRVWKSNLYRNNTRSCGCLQNETQRRWSGVSAKYPAEHSTWAKMIRRCHNENAHNYRYYGGRGVIVCERWRKSFTNFLADLGPRPSKAHSLERSNNNRNYEPGNVVWATKNEQANNTRANVSITHNGETRTVAQWAALLGMSYGTLYHRLKRGVDIERAMSKRDLRCPSWRSLKFTPNGRVE